MNVYLNNIATAVPPNDIHQKFIDYVPAMLPDPHQRKLFKKMVERSQIEHRYSFLKPASNPEQLDCNEFYKRNTFPGTQTRMQFYEKHALALACKALDQLLANIAASEITHLIITSCTGFYAPGLDLQIISHYGMNPTLERTIVGFMGCNAAINALKIARHIVRSDKSAKVSNAKPCWDQPLAIFGIPYGFVHNDSTNTEKELYRLGDQMAVIPSFSGDGMAIALHTATRAVESILRGDDNYHSNMRKELFTQIRRASMLSIITSTSAGQALSLVLCNWFPVILTHIANNTRLKSFQHKISLKLC